MAGAAAIGLLAASAGQQYGASKASGAAAQRIGEYNASIAEFKADDAIARGRDDEGRHRLKTRSLIGSTRTAFAASGVDVNDPDSTAVNVQANIAALSEIDALTIRANAAREAWGYKIEAADATNRGQLARMEGDSRAIGSLLSTAGNVYYSKYGFQGSSRGTRY